VLPCCKSASPTLGDITVQDIANTLLEPWWVALLPNDPTPGQGVIPTPGGTQGPSILPSLSPDQLKADAAALQSKALYYAVGVGVLGTLAAVAGVAYLVKK
jgi:hypothetical protein